tara:strand:- start:10 stop:381 length:372 start_codon:yes stop_codon:yes gene_type:complete
LENLKTKIMAKKTTSVKKKTLRKKSRTKKTMKSQEENSMGIMILAIIGLVILVWLSTNVTIETKVSVDMPNESNEMIDSSIIISGKKYASKENAYNTLKKNPQTMMTNEEILFVEKWVVDLEE